MPCSAIATITTAAAADPHRIRSAVLWSVYGLLGNAVLVLPVQLLIVHGYVPLYHDVSAYGWLYLAASMIGAVAFSRTSCTPCNANIGSMLR